MNFGNYALLTPVAHAFEKEPTWTWTFKPIDMGAELTMSQFVARDRFVIFQDGARAPRPITTEEIAMREIALLFGGTTVPKDSTKPVAEGGEPILNDDATVVEIEAVLASMPPKMVSEIWKALGESCPPWGPALPGQKDKGEPKKAPSKKR